MRTNFLTRLLQASLMCCLAVLFTACEEFGMESNPTPSYISFNSKAVTLNIEQTVTYKAIVAGTAVVIYSSSNEAVATVDQAGKVTAVSEGTATITALVTGYDAAGRKIYTPEEKSYTVTVVDPVESLTLDQTALSVGIGATKTITATVNPAGYTVMWTSSDESVATVENGVVTGVAEGTATITAKAGGKVKTCAVTVSAAWAANEYNEASWDSGDKKVIFTKKTAASVTAVTNSDTDVTWGDGWYTVSGNVTITGNVGLTADTHLILQDGAKLTINGRILGSNKNLSIYGQANQTGQLVVNYSNNDAIRSIITLEVHGCQVTATSSSSGCGGFDGIVTFNVYGGSVDAESTGTNGNGIYLAYNGSMNIYGGDVKAIGKGSSRQGITGSSSTVTVYGGTLWAENADNKALLSTVTLAKGASFTGKIETSGDGSSWTDWTTSGTPSTKYVRVGY